MDAAELRKNIGRAGVIAGAVAALAAIPLTSASTARATPSAVGVCIISQSASAVSHPDISSLATPNACYW